MLKREIFKLFQLIEPYRIYDKDEDRFLGTIKIKEDAPYDVKEAYEKLLQWQKRVEVFKKKGCKF